MKISPDFYSLSSAHPLVSVNDYLTMPDHTLISFCYHISNITLLPEPGTVQNMVLTQYYLKQLTISILSYRHFP